MVHGVPLQTISPWSKPTKEKRTSLLQNLAPGQVILGLGTKSKSPTLI
jgi:hypothetical protein